MLVSKLYRMVQRENAVYKRKAMRLHHIESKDPPRKSREEHELKQDLFRGQYMK